DEDDDMPVDKTRIEQNPLQKIKELEASTVSRHPVPPGSITGAEPLPAPPTGPFSAKPPVGAAQSAKFPNLAHLPTQIADDTGTSPRAPELVSTQMGAAVIDQPTMDGLPAAPNQPMHGGGSQPMRQPPNMAPPGGSPYPVVSG